MLYYCSLFREAFSPLNIFSYITFRTGGAILTSLVLTWLIGPKFIAVVKSKQITQPIRSDGPSTHHSKSGTPIMGGLLILMTTLFSTILWCRPDNRFVWLAWITILFLGALGFIDDYRKWRRVEGKKELTPAIKLAAQLFLAIGIVSYLFIYPPNHEFLTKVNIPYLKEKFIDLGFWYICFAIIVIVGSSNAVNLTDGLDGLAIGSLVVSSLTFAIFAYLASHAKFSQYLKIIMVPGAGELAIFLAAIAGAGLGFLWYNGYPAEIFMGDTGSLFLGGLLGLVAVIIKQELILIVVGGLFVIEVLSVLIQVYSFRLHGKRVFKMAPLHHHFELSGWQEPKVVIRFWIISIVLALLALASLKLR